MSGPKHFLFIHEQLGIGGTETLMVRMAGWLLKHGHRVTVLCSQSGEAETFFDSRCRIVSLGADYFALAWRGVRFAQSVLARLTLTGPEMQVVVAFDDPALWIGASLNNAADHPLILSAGAWAPGAFSGKGWYGMLRNPSSWIFQTQLKPESRLYMSDATKLDIERRSGKEIPGIVWPLPVEGGRFQSVFREPEKGLIVSIGRLADIKTYHFYMLDVLRSLLDNGYKLRWDVYGDGPHRSRIEKKIQERGLENVVRLCGSISYAAMPETLRKAWLFLGMGTSLLEAGFAGVPGIVAIAGHQDPTSYGFVYDLPDYACGEVIDKPVVEISSLIIRLLSMSEAEYQAECHRTRRHVDRFALGPGMDRFIALVEQMPKRTTTRCPATLWLASRFCLFLRTATRRWPVWGLFGYACKNETA